MATDNEIKYLGQAGTEQIVATVKNLLADKQDKITECASDKYGNVTFGNSVRAPGVYSEQIHPHDCSTEGVFLSSEYRDGTPVLTIAGSLGDEPADVENINLLKADQVDTKVARVLDDNSMGVFLTAGYVNGSPILTLMGSENDERANLEGVEEFRAECIDAAYIYSPSISLTDIGADGVYINSEYDGDIPIVYMAGTKGDEKVALLGLDYAEADSLKLTQYDDGSRYVIATFEPSDYTVEFRSGLQLMDDNDDPVAIHGIARPYWDSDAANKQYVDEKVSSIFPDGPGILDYVETSELYVHSPDNADKGVRFLACYDNNTPVVEFYGSEDGEDSILAHIASPSEYHHAANKKYVDEAIAAAIPDIDTIVAAVIAALPKAEEASF